MASVRRAGKMNDCDIQATYDDSELVEAIEDIEQRSLASVDQVRRLKQWCLRHAERLGGRHETLNVAQSHETRRRFRSVEDRRHSSRLQQTIHQPTAIAEYTLWAKKAGPQTHDQNSVKF